ncbi:MAG: FHA domain-containing protein [Anaerolineae bacterium]|jgi:hypothetical protein|nr:FHA domain-containing protein [Anaerolineae bacterium]
MQGSDIYRLVVRRGPQPNQTYDITKDITTLGRDITNDIVINDPEVSRHHLRITRTPEGCTLEDLGSTNGTFINGQRLSGSRPLNNGDMVGLGETVTLGYERVRQPGMGYGDVPAATAPNNPPVGTYAPPQQGVYNPPAQPQSQNPSGYAPQQPYYPPSQPPTPAQAPGYNAPYGDPQQAQYGAYNAPQAPSGYDYDPYAVRDEEPNNAMRWILFGCLGLAVFCCCISAVSLVLIDTLNLWDDLPIISSIAPVLAELARNLGF